MTSQPQISSVMLCWNRLPLSKRCLTSYLETVCVPYELFVIDNASTDATRAWMDEVRSMPGVTCVVRRDANDPATAINDALLECGGRYLHIMENDYVYLSGWDRYILDRFERIPDLGQLGLFRGETRFHGHYRDRLVFLARENVCTTSVLRRKLFFEQGVRVHGHYIRNLYPDDYDLSKQVRRAGWIVAWPDRDLARNIGFDPAEYDRDPDYYIRNYTLKLFSASRLYGQARRWVRLDFHDSVTILRRLLHAYRLKLRHMLTRR